MVPYRFAAVLRYREQLLEQVQREFAALQGKLMFEMSRLTMLEQTKREQSEEVARLQQGGAAIREIGLYHLVLDRLYVAIVQQRKRLQRLNGELGAKREDLVLAMQKKKILEKIKERDAEAQWEAEQRRERLLADEMVVNKTARAMSLSRQRDGEEESAGPLKEGR